MVMALFSLSAMASDNGASSLNERFYQAKLREMVYRLHITTEQQKKFEPMYRAYCEEMTALWNERKKPIKPSTSTDAAAMAKRKMEMQQRAQGMTNLPPCSMPVRLTVSLMWSLPSKRSSRNAVNRPAASKKEF